MCSHKKKHEKINRSRRKIKSAKIYGELSTLDILTLRLFIVCFLFIAFFETHPNRRALEQGSSFAKICRVKFLPTVWSFLELASNSTKTGSEHVHCRYWTRNFFQSRYLFDGRSSPLKLASDSTKTGSEHVHCRYWTRNFFQKLRVSFSRIIWR